MEIFVVSKPTLNWESIENFLDIEHTSWDRDGATDGDSQVELAGRICYMSFGENQYRKRNREYINNLIKNGHESVLEHAVWSFILTGVSRSFSHQIVRHRIGFSFSQLSQQYHNELEGEYVIPEIIRGSKTLLKKWNHLINNLKSESDKFYAFVDEVLDSDSLSNTDRRKLLNTTFRSVLPNAKETKIFVTANARALRHFFDIRGGTVWDDEMRMVCIKLFNKIKEDAPSLFNDFKVKELNGRDMLIKE